MNQVNERDPDLVENKTKTKVQTKTLEKVTTKTG